MKRVEASKEAPGGKVLDSSYWIKFALPIGIFVLAFLVRFIYLIQIKSSLPFFLAPQMDELFHDTWAQQIASGAWMGEESFFRAPLYVYLLALTYKIFGHDLFVPRLLQVLLGSSSCVLTFLIAKKLFNPAVGILSGVIASFYAMLVFYDGQLLITSLVVFLDLLMVGLLILTAERPRVLNWLFCGLVVGLSAIARPNILILVPFILVWMFFEFKNKLPAKAVLLRWIILCFAVLLVILPVSVRNYIVSKDFVPIAWQGGYNFYLGNNPNATGWSATAPEIDETWWGGYKDAIWLAEEEKGIKLKPSQISDFWFGKGFDFIFTHPLSWLKLMARKTLYFWKGYEISNNVNIYLYRDFSSLLDVLLGEFIIYLPFGLIGPLSVLGLLIGLKDLRRYLLLYLFVLSYSASVILFFVCSRYRMPVIPFLIMFASFSVWWLFQKVRKRKTIPLVISLAVLAILAATLNTRLENLVPHKPYEDHHRLGLSYYRLGKLELAIREYKTSLEINPDFVFSRNNLALIYAGLGRTDAAVEEYKRAILSDPFYEKSYYNLANVYFGQGDWDMAIECYLKAIRADARYEKAFIALGKAYYQKGLVEEAKEQWRRALELNPDNREVIKALEFLNGG